MIHPCSWLGLFVGGVMLTALIWDSDGGACAPGSGDGFDVHRLSSGQRAYELGLLFVLIGIAVTFLIPWALAHMPLVMAQPSRAIAATGAALGFVAPLAVGLFFLWRKGWLT